MGCLRMMIMPISKNQISAISNPFLISEDDTYMFLTVELHRFVSIRIRICGGGPQMRLTS